MGGESPITLAVNTVSPGSVLVESWSQELGLRFKPKNLMLDVNVLILKCQANGPTRLKQLNPLSSIL